MDLSTYSTMIYDELMLRDKVIDALYEILHDLGYTEDAIIKLTQNKPEATNG